MSSSTFSSNVRQGLCEDEDVLYKCAFFEPTGALLKATLVNAAVDTDDG